MIAKAQKLLNHTPTKTYPYPIDGLQGLQGGSHYADTVCGHIHALALSAKNFHHLFFWKERRVSMAVLLETSKGDIVIDLFVDDAPITCKNFVKLCK